MWINSRTFFLVTVSSAGVAATACTQHDATAFVHTITTSASATTESAPCVRTPFGDRSALLTHHVAAGNIVGVWDGRIQERGVEGAVVRDYGPLAAIASAIASSPCSGSNQPLTASSLSGGVQPTYGSGWIAYSTWDRPTGDAITHDSTRWIVPPQPATSNNQTIFIFNGVQGDTSILQPVLQWGSAADGGGAYYTMNCWYLLGSGTWYGTPVAVSPGDTIHAAVDSGTGGVTKYTCSFVAPPHATQTLLVGGSPPEMPQAVEALEAYAITACSDYPDTFDIAMDQISILTHTGRPSLNWSHHNRITDCGQQAIIASNANPGGEVDLYFRAPPPHANLIGISEIDTKGTYTWNVTASGGSGSYTYQWTLHEDGSSSTNTGTSSSQARTVYLGDPNFWWIVSVMSGGMTAKDSLYVYNCIGNPGCGIQ